MPGKLTVTYFHHSGFSVAVDDTLLLFDYWLGEGKSFPVKARLTQADFEPYKRVLIFVTHSHMDHFDDVIYTFAAWHNDVTYIVSDDIPVGKRGKRMKPGDTMTVGPAFITAYESTDLGVSYYVEIGDLHIFHAGDLNLWHWREESTLCEIAEAEEAFYNAVDPLTKLSIDVCMFPLDPRQGGMFDAGINHFVLSVKPRVLIPMHWQGRPEVALDYMRKGRTKYTDILPLTRPREKADIELTELDLNIHLHTPALGLYEEKEETGNASDPFSDTDLPVNVK